MSESTRVRFLATLVNGYPFSSDDFSNDPRENDIPLARIRDIKNPEFTTFIDRKKVPDEVVIQNGDLVIGMDGDFNSKIWDKGPAALNQRMCLLRSLDSKTLRFISYAIPDQLKLINELTYSTTVKHLSSEQVLGLPLPDLDLKQRHAIADYLDRETAEIDGIRADLDEMERLLTERRAAIVADLLLKNPSVVYVSLGLLFTLEDHLRIPVKAGDRKEMAGNVPYYGASGVIDYVSKPIWTDCTRLLVSEDGANLALRNHPIAFTASGDFWVNNHAHILRENQQHSYDLAASGISVTDISGFLSGSAQPKLTAESMSRIKVPWLNHPSQRRSLVTEIDRETAEIDSMLEDITKLRDLLAERRAAVISAAVTGRICIPVSPTHEDEPHA